MAVSTLKDKVSHTTDTPSECKCDHTQRLIKSQQQMLQHLSSFTFMHERVFLYVCVLHRVLWFGSLALERIICKGVTVALNKLTTAHQISKYYLKDFFC